MALPDHLLPWLAIAAVALLLGIIILLISLLVIRQRDRRKDSESWQQFGQSVMNEVYNEMDAQRDELVNLMHQNGDTMIAHMNAMAQTQAISLDSMGRRLNEMQTGMDGLRRENDSQLLQMRLTIEQKLSETLADTVGRRLDSSFAQVSGWLEEVYKGLGEMQTLAAGVGDLKKVLTNVKTRGIWGEMQLGALISEILAPAQYGENVAVIPGSRERVEYAVRLPGSGDGPVWLPIDSKFPQEDYARLVASEDRESAEAARSALRQRLKTEAKRISEKYIRAPYTTDFAIMFLPLEGLYAEAMRDTDLAEELQRKHRVITAGPGTLAALLNALQTGFKTLAVQERTSEVWALLGHVREDFSRFGEALQKTQSQLQQASSSLDTAFSKTRAIQKRLSSLEQLDGPSESALPLSPAPADPSVPYEPADLPDSADSGL